MKGADVEWFRAYSSIKDDPKILGLSPENRWFYVALLAVSSEQTDRGTLPNLDDLAISLRVRKAKAAAVVAALRDRGLIDCDVATKRLAIHGWGKRQRRTDDVAARVKRHRETHPKRYPAAPCNVTETLPHARATETETETETESPLSPPLGGTHAPAGDAAPIVDRHRVSDDAASRWGAQGLDTAESLLNVYRPSVVAYAADETFGKFGRSLTTQATRYWRSICRDNPDGPPARPQAPRGAVVAGRVGRSDVSSSRASPGAAERPLTEHQRKMAALAAIAYGPTAEGEDDGTDGGGLGAPGDVTAREAAQPPRRAYAGH